ncbi:MAG: endonuclease/exonuclease/phosphatase family protein [Burkholderiales bacterium]|nr:endonuclease/exonuclease/phosphatase family protein [Burkholderiales bacterium]
MTPRLPSEGTRATRLKVVTFNTWKCDGDYALRLEAMCQQMKALQADVVALQETFATFDGTTDTARVLARSLGMQLHTAPARRKMRRFQGEWVDSFSSLTVLSRLPIRSGEQMELPSTVADGGRLAQFCSLEVDGKSVLLINAHLSHLPQSEGGGALRAQQLRTLLDQSAQMPQHDLTLLCGDFNAAMDSAELSPFMRPPWALLDAFAQAGGAEKFTYRTPEGQGLNLDHILCVPSCSHMAVDYLDASVALNAPMQPPDVLPSDHVGVCVTFSLG